MNGRAYYNDNDKFVCAWLRNLIAAGLVAPGDVDERDIRDVQPDDLRGYTQCHFFAGIGGWSYALRLAGVPDSRPVWTASCPCPPFSVAGKRQKCPKCESGLLVWCPRRTGYAICADCGHAWLADARHLWPEVWRLAAIRRPERIFGEQVASIEAIDWLAGVRGSLEVIGYNLGATALCSCGVGAPNIRQRNFWVADTKRDAGESWRSSERPSGRHESQKAGTHDEFGRCGDDGRLADTMQSGWPERRSSTGRGSPTGSGDIGWVDDTASVRYQPARAGTESQVWNEARLCGPECGCDVGHTASADLWRQSVLVPCADGKWRRVPANKEGNPEPTLFPVVTGVPNRLGTLRGSGNAINPKIAAEFILAYQETEGLNP
jgi:DNA (cytosine-5)-methyltransferase 1